MPNSLLEMIKEKLAVSVPTNWASDVQTQGEMVALYRQYAAGEHRAKMTSEMKAMLRIDDERTQNFVDNYCDMVIQAMADRLTISQIRGDNDVATAWADAVLHANRIDGLQMDVHEAAIRDGVTYIMVAYDGASERPLIVHELAYDGDVGMIAVYDRMGKAIVAAVKIWLEGADRRVNIYRAASVERYVVVDGADVVVAHLERLGVDTWQDLAGRPVGVPVVAFVNRARPRLTTGISEIGGIVTLQDALNRTVVSMVLTAELTAFQIRVAIGFAPPRNLAPGSWIEIAPTGVEEGQRLEVATMEQGAIAPFIDQARFLIDQISMVSATPLPGAADSSASGEALKQREIRLLGKVRRFQVKAGNAWEDVMALAHRTAAAYGLKQPPAGAAWATAWQEAELRNASEVIDNALKLREIIGERETLRLAATVTGWSESKIDAILQERARETTNALAALGGSLPGFAQFALPDADAVVVGS